MNESTNMWSLTVGLPTNLDIDLFASNMKPKYKVKECKSISEWEVGAINRSVLNGVRLQAYPLSRGGYRLSYAGGGSRVRLERSSWDDTLAEAAKISRALTRGDGIAANAATHEELVALGLFLRENPGWSLSSILDYVKKDGGPKAGATPYGTLPFKDTVSTYLLSLQDNGAGERHLNSTRQRLNQAAKAFKKPVGSILTPEIDAYLSQIKSPKTRLNHRTTLVTLFRWAARQGLLPPEALTAAERSALPKQIVSDPEIYTVEEAAELLRRVVASGDKKLLAFVVIGLFTGIRSAEISRLTWASIRDNGIHLSPEITKTSRRRIVEIPDNLRLWLEPLQKEFAKEALVTYTSSQPLYQELKNAVKTLWKPNAMRHSFVSYHLELHRNPPRTAKTTGHSTQILERCYLKLVDGAAAEKYFQLTPDTTAANP